MPRPYVPLHLHSHYSVLDGASKVPDLVKIAAENNMPAIALTDHGVMHGAIELYQHCRKMGVKPIVGCEIYLLDGDPTDKVTKKKPNHLILLAKDNAGYKNLVKLVTKGQLEGYYYKPRVSWEQLADYSSGLVALTACLGGPISQPILQGNPEEARERASKLKNMFGDDFYLELQSHGIEGEQRVNAEMIKIARELDIELALTNDSHYSYKGQDRAHDVLLCLQMGKTLEDPTRMKFYGPEFYVKNGDEMVEAFHHYDSELVDRGLENTLNIAEKIDLQLDMDQSILPHFPVPEGMSVESYLREVTTRCAENRLDGSIPKDYQDRLDYELGIIEHMGFPSYFLTVWDFIDHAKQKGIPVGPGRGSAAGSLVAYSLGITNIDPIEHNLLFERFLNPERISMPDIDIDFCIERRGDVIKYVEERYGKERVAQIVTFGTLAARAALKGVARVLDIPFAESDRLAKMIPATPGTKLAEAIEPDMPLGKLYKEDARVKQIVDLALELEGTISNTGVHAAGVVISKDPLDEIVPLMVSKEGQLVTQYAMDHVASLGLLKMDFLGLRNLTIIDNTINLVSKHKGEQIDIEHLGLDDAAVFKMLETGDTDGVFQLESSGMKALVRDLKPTNFEDINALVALFRPGPLNSGMAEMFVKRKHGREKISYEHPDLEPLLKDTYGTIVYQEQIMQVAQTLGGYTLGQADLLRRAMGKKKPEEMEKQREIFLDGCEKHGVNTNVADKLFEAMAEFAAYCFNRSHSAAYALIAYQTAFLKKHYPVEYISALLSSVMSDLDKVKLYSLLAQKMGIKVLPPDIAISDKTFTPDGQAIRFGLACIKHVGEGVVEKIIASRDAEKNASGNAFETIEDFCDAVGLKNVNRRTLESLMMVGAFDRYGISRKKLLANVDNMYSYSQKRQHEKDSGQASLFSLLSEPDAAKPKILWEGPDEEFAPSELQQFEKDLLGTYVSSHPLNDVQGILPLTATRSILELADVSDGTEVVLSGLITTLTHRTTKTNKPMVIGQLEDLTGTVEFVGFSEVCSQYAECLYDGKKVSITGKLQYRGDDSYSIMVNSMRLLDDVHILNLNAKQRLKYEDIAFLGQCLARVRGGDPVIVSWPDKTKTMLGQQFWIDSTKADDMLKPMLETRFGETLELAWVS
jgi:DNA polymerase III subunit alpha